MKFLNLFHLHYFVRIIDMFRRFDVNKDGTLSHQEFRDGIIAAGSARISITNSSVRLTVHQICSISRVEISSFTKEDLTYKNGRSIMYTA